MNAKPITFPLIGMPNPRATDVTAALAALQDQLFINCLFEKVQNPVTGQTFLACDKRPGVGDAITGVSGATYGVETIHWVGATDATYANISLFFGSSPESKVVRGSSAFTLIEAMSTPGNTALNNLKESTVNLVSTILMTAADNKAYYFTQDAATTAVTFTADTTNGSPTLANVSSTTGLLHGQTISGTGVPASTRLSIVGSTVTLMDSSGVAVNATATNAGVTMTRSIIARIVSPAFPGNATLGKTLAGNFVDLNGFVFIMDTQGNVWNSDLNSCVNWTATSFINASEVPDAGVGLARKGNTLCAFGSKTVEFFVNNGNPSGTILVRTGSPLEVGCASALSILQYDDTVYWIGRRASEELGIYVLDGAQAKLISPAFVNADITQYSTVVGYLRRFSMGGHPILTALIYTSPTYRSWVFQMDVGQWGRWQDSTGNATYWYRAAIVPTGGVDRILHVTESSGNGFITDLKTPVYTDAGVVVTRTIRTRVLDFGTATRKFLHKLRLVGAKMASACNITVTYSDDDYATQSTARTFDMTLADNKLTRLGSFNRRSFTFTDAATSNCRLEYIEVPTGGMDVGTS